MGETVAVRCIHTSNMAPGPLSTGVTDGGGLNWMTELPLFSHGVGVAPPGVRVGPPGEVHTPSQPLLQQGNGLGAGVGGRGGVGGMHGALFWTHVRPAL